MVLAVVEGEVDQEEGVDLEGVGDEVVEGDFKVLLEKGRYEMGYLNRLGLGSLTLCRLYHWLERVQSAGLC